MTKITFGTNYVKASGHACFAEEGKDIVCSSISSIFFFVNDLLNSKKSDYKFIVCEKENIITIIFDDEELKHALKVFFENLKNAYPKNILIKEEEKCL